MLGMADTNLVAALVAALQQQKAVLAPDTNTVEVAQIIINALTPILLAIVVWIQKTTDGKIKEVSEAAKITSGVVTEIKQDVNSERTKMIDKLEALSGVFTDVSKENAVLKEQRRVEDAAVASAAIAQAALDKRGPPVEMSEVRSLLRSMIASELELAQRQLEKEKSNE